MGKILKATGINKCIGCFSCMLACAAVNHHNHSIIKSAIKIQTYGGFRGKMFSTVCLGCTDERACREACPTDSLKIREGGGVLLNETTCIGCKKCVEACIASAVFFDEETKKPIICKHCGFCINFCPHECLVLEEK